MFFFIFYLFNYLLIYSFFSNNDNNRPAYWFNLFHSNFLFLCPLKRQKTSGFDFFVGYRKRTLVLNGFINGNLTIINFIKAKLSISSIRASITNKDINQNINSG